MKSLALGSFGSLTIPMHAHRWLHLPSTAEMRALDAGTVCSGVPALKLMEQAGYAVAQQVMRSAAKSSGVLILCGPGNNGGDGLVVARLLRDAGLVVTAVIASSKRFSGELLHQIERYPEVRYFAANEEGANNPPFGESISAPEILSIIDAGVAIVDAMLGTGQTGAPRGAIGALVELVATHSAARRPRFVIAVDIPTGTCADTGRVFEPYIQADCTVCLGLIKRGLMQMPARRTAGKLVVADIGLLDTESAAFSLVVPDIGEKVLERAANSHKGTMGHVLVIGGSREMPGAPILTSVGALRSGAGLVSRTTSSKWQSPGVPPELLTNYVESGSSYCPEDLDAVRSWSLSADAVALGPGIGKESGVVPFVNALLESLSARATPLVLDADGLNVVAMEPRKLYPRVVITPHPAEAARLLGCDTKEIQRDRFAAVQELSKKYGCVALLKGAGTIVHDGTKGHVVACGTPYLATGGSGDVLTGIIAALLGRGVDPMSAATFGAYIHARAGEVASAFMSGPIVASDIAASIPAVVGALERC